MQFKKATKKAARLRLSLIGPAGSGKTYTALTIASHLGGKVAVIDTERGSASKYADLFDFDCLELETFAPATYVEALAAAVAGGYQVVIIDSLSHAWTGKEGALEQVDKATARQKSHNTFSAWREVTPQHNAMVDAILRCSAHVIATMRVKTEYIVEKDEKTGKSTPRKVGLAPVQRDGLEYEFDLVGDMDIDNTLVVSKTRCPALARQVIQRPGKELAQTLSAWLGTIPETPHFPAQETQPTAKKSPPQDGKDFAKRLDEYDRKLTSWGLCERGDLLNHMKAVGEQGNYPENLSDWPLHSFETAGQVVREFESRLREAKAKK